MAPHLVRCLWITGVALPRASCQCLVPALVLLLLLLPQLRRLPYRLPYLPPYPPLGPRRAA